MPKITLDLPAEVLNKWAALANDRQESVADTMSRFLVRKTQSRLQDKWYSITFPKILDNTFTYNLWKQCLCPLGIHLFDEYASSNSHGLMCSGCELIVAIEEDEE